MKKPILVVMAAGMGSRYGGLKQIDPVSEEGEKIIDFSVYDAMRAGFEKVVFIIKREMEDQFRETFGAQMSPHIGVEYAFQDLDNLPEGFRIPNGRIKPWGTAHAILCAKDLIDGPFAVVNADDYYGPEAFQLIYDYLSTHEDDEFYRYAMVAFLLKNTVTENGTVSRGVCSLNATGELLSIREYTKIGRIEDGIAYTEDDGKSWHPLDGDTVVSMNMLGFSQSILSEIERGFPAFLRKGLSENPQKCEYYIPSVITDLLTSGKAKMEVLTTSETWYGITYKEDKRAITEAIRRKKEEGLYPEHLWN